MSSSTLIDIRPHSLSKDTVLNAIKNFIADEAGITAIEYALMAAGIAIVVGTASTALGTAISGTFSKIKALLPQ